MLRKLKQKLRRFADNNTRNKYNVDCMKESDNKERYKQDLYSAIETLQVEKSDTIEGKWKEINEAFKKTLEESFGMKKRKHTVTQTI